MKTFAKSGFQRYKNITQVRHHCPGVPCIVVGTQVDLRDDPAAIEKLSKNRQKPISTENGDRLAKDLAAIKYLECSALTQKGNKSHNREAICFASDFFTLFLNRKATFYNTFL
jgi:cell division control protein 42